MRIDDGLVPAKLRRVAITSASCRRPPRRKTFQIESDIVLAMSSPLYTSRTRELPFSEVPEPLRQALTDHATKGVLVLDHVRVWITHRENPESSSFLGRLFGRRSNPADPDPEHDMALVLHSTHLLVGTHGPSRGTAILSLPLLQATVARGSLLAGRLGADADTPTDDGLSISGFPGSDGRPGSYFMGLGPGADAEACVEAVTAALSRVKNPG